MKASEKGIIMKRVKYVFGPSSFREIWN